MVTCFSFCALNKMWQIHSYIIVSLSILKLSVDLKVERRAGQLRDFVPAGLYYLGEGGGPVIYRM